MTRKQLAALGATKVRKDKGSFALFKQYITEDAKHIFPGGKLPPECFSCQFQSNFAKWASFITKDTKKDKAMSSQKTYTLKDSAYRVYFKGQILDKNSSDSEWAEWIGYAPEEKRQKRIGQFEVLPESLREKQEEKRTRKKANDQQVKEDE